MNTNSAKAFTVMVEMDWSWEETRSTVRKDDIVKYEFERNSNRKNRKRQIKWFDHFLPMNEQRSFSSIPMGTTNKSCPGMMA